MNIDEIEKHIESLRLKFTSGNGIHVTRAYITRDEYDALIAHVRELERQNDELRAELDGDDLPLRDKLATAEGLIAIQLERMADLERQVKEMEADARRWQWARANLLSMCFQDGKYKSNRTSIQPCFEDVTSEYWDGVADRAIAALNKEQPNE